jgi:hypothetical protein
MFTKQLSGDGAELPDREAEVPGHPIEIVLHI